MSDSFCNPVDCSIPGFPVLHYLLEFAQTHVNCVDDAISLQQVAKVLELWLSVSPSNESGLISFRTDWFDPLAVQENLKSLFQYRNSKALIQSTNRGTTEI